MLVFRDNSPRPGDFLGISITPPACLVTYSSSSILTFEKLLKNSKFRCHSSSSCDNHSLRQRGQSRHVTQGFFSTKRAGFGVSPRKDRAFSSTAHRDTWGLISQTWPWLNFSHITLEHPMGWDRERQLCLLGLSTTSFFISRNSISPLPVPAIPAGGRRIPDRAEWSLLRTPRLWCLSRILTCDTQTMVLGQNSHQ